MSIKYQQSEDGRSILSEQLQKFNHSIFQIPNFDSAAYKRNICDVFKKVSELQNFTDNLQYKVDSLLAAQQKQFVNAYTSHMRKIKQQFKAFEQQALKQQQLIKYYENQGKMSNLVKKVAMLEQESKNLYGLISKKDKQLKDMIIQNKVQKQQNKRLTNTIRQMLRAKNKAQINLKTQQNKSDFFATEVLQCDKSLKKDLSRTTDQKTKQGLKYHLSQNSILVHQPDKTHQNSLRKKIYQLQNKNRKLANINTKVMDSRNQLQNLFLDAVSQIKRQVKLRKKINYCSYEDFKKQDKLNLLVMIISNEQLLKVVYEKLFNHSFFQSKKNSLNPQEKSINFDSSTSQYLHNYTKYKKKKQESSFNGSQKDRGQKSKDLYIALKNSTKIQKRGHTEDISVLPYI